MPVARPSQCRGTWNIAYPLQNNGHTALAHKKRKTKTAQEATSLRRSCRGSVGRPLTSEPRDADRGRSHHQTGSRHCDRRRRVDCNYTREIRGRKQDEAECHEFYGLGQAGQRAETRQS